MQFTTRKVSVDEGLYAAGYDTCVRRGRVLVRYGSRPDAVRTYSFRRRVGDGHVLTRRGRLTGARIVTFGGTGPVLVEFTTD